MSIPKQITVYIIGVILTLISCFKVSSQNLLANGDFEDENTCSEYNEKCSPTAWINTSIETFININTYSIEPPEHGKHSVKILAGNSLVKGQRSFLSTQLLCGLRKGSQYEIHFFIKASIDTFDSLGIMLSPSDFILIDKSFKDISPNIWVTGVKRKENQNSGSWQKVTCNFIANGEERFFTIGYFKREDYQNARPQQTDQEEYIFLDDINLFPTNASEVPCTTYDSLKKVLYSRHDRHSRLMKYRLAYIYNPPKLLILSRTRIRSIDTLTISDITFKSNNSNLDTSVTEKISNVLKGVSLSSIDSLVVEGYADSSGNHLENLQLSKDRSSSVFEYISAKYNLPNYKIIPRFYGDKKPLASNSTFQGRNKNRRVSIFIYRTN